VLSVFRIVATAVTLVMAYGAQMLLDRKVPAQWVGGWSQTTQFRVAQGMYLASLVIFGLIALPPVVAFRRARRTDRADLPKDRPDARIVRLEAASSSPEKARPNRRVQLARAILAAAAVAMAVSAVLIFWQRGESGAVRWLWLVSLGLLVLSQMPMARSALRSRDWGTWIVQFVLALAVAGLAFALRFTLLEAMPSDFHGDMASHGLEARKVLAGQQTQWFATMWAEIPTLAFVPSALGLRLFGNNLFGLRMTSVIGGTLTVLGLVLLVRELFDGQTGRRVAIISGVVLAISYVHIHFSRIAEYMDPWSFALFSMYLLVRGLKRHERLSMVGSGILLAACLQMYYSARIVPIIMAAFLIYVVLVHQDLRRGNWGGIVLFGLATLMGLGPMIPFYLQHPFNFVNRSRSVFRFHPPVMEHLKGKYGVGTETEVILEQLKRSLLVFHQSIDSSTQFGLARPMLDSYSGPVLALGAGYALRRLRKPGHALTMLWLLLLLIVGSVLTNNAPFWPRLVGLLPPAAILIGLALERVWALVEHAWGDTASALLALLLLAGAIYVGVANWELYVDAVEDSARPRARIGRFLHGLDEDVNACLVSEPYHLSVREVAFLAYPRTTIDMPPDTRGQGLEACPGPRRVFILTDSHLDLLPELQARFPNGVTEEHHESNGTLVFVSYMLEG